MLGLLVTSSCEQGVKHLASFEKCKLNESAENFSDELAAG